MRIFPETRILILLLSALPGLMAQTVPGKDVTAESKGLPPRAAPVDYQVQAVAGAVTIAAEFTGHGIPTFEGPLNTEDFVAVETALFGPAGERLRIAAQDFSLRVNGKTPLPSQPYGLIVSSLRDPEWIPPDQPAQKSKSSFGAGGQGQGQGEPSGPPPPVKIPIPLQRAMAQKVQKAALPEGDRALPQAGLLFFQYRGKEKSLQTVELIYEGPAGKATLKLLP